MMRNMMYEKHQQFLSEIDAKIIQAEEIIERAKLVQKGDQGDKPVAGVDYPIPKDGQSVDHDKVVADVLGKIKQPKDGETPVVDYKKVATLAAKLIPKPKDGKSVDEKGIVQQVLDSLRTGKKLHIKDIEGFNEGLEQTIAPIRSLAAGFRGGGDTVVAGTGITITTNANGNKVLTSSGGGFTTLSATETPNGVITVFTFATATAQPSFIISDNVMQRAVTGAGTVNWTWNAGLKQATLAVPPVDDCLGIV